jgi:hypothetical protein
MGSFFITVQARSDQLLARDNFQEGLALKVVLILGQLGIEYIEYRADGVFLKSSLPRQRF